MLSEKIKILRINFGLSQVALADKLGVSKQCVSNWENDNIQPSIEMLVKIAKFFNVSTDYLLDMNNDTSSLDVFGLNEKQITHVKFIISDMLEGNKK